MLNSHLAQATVSGCYIEVNPSQPTELDEVTVFVSLLFRTYAPYVVDFGSVIRNGNVLSVNVTVSVPRSDEYVLQVIHADNFTYQIGKLEAGNYTFQLYIKTINGIEQFWLEKTTEFTVTPIKTMPEFPTGTVFLAILLITTVFAIVYKKQTIN